MKYASIFFTLLIVWLAVVIIAVFVPTSEQRFQLFMLVTLFTLALFLIGFRKNR
jgi:hypothetical protein